MEVGGARDRHWLESSFLLVFKSCSPLGSKDLGQVDGGGWGKARVANLPPEQGLGSWPGCLPPHQVLF